MLKHFYKRVVAGMLSILTAVTMLPVSVFADDVPTDTSGSGIDANTAAEIQEIIEVMQYLETLGSDYSLPAIMISEGDTVYDNDDYVIASTVKAKRMLLNSLPPRGKCRLMLL